MTEQPFSNPASVAIVGGGLAGIAAAWALGDAGLAVILLEARGQLGGRATSYLDKSTGQTIDNCQHVNMGCCTNLKSLAAHLGIDEAFRREQTLYFIGPDGRTVRFQADRFPAPFHLTRAFQRLPYLSLREKLLFALAVRGLAKADPKALQGQDFESWLRQHHQTENLIRNAWDVVLVSALSESLDRIDAAYARKVFVDGFLANTDGWIVEIPSTSLDELYSVRTRKHLEELGVDVRLQSRASGIDVPEGELPCVVMQSGEIVRAEDVILAVPFHQVAKLLPDRSELEPLRQQVSQFESAPITSVHLWFDRPVTELPHAVLIDRLGQWIFSRGEQESQGHRSFAYQVVISASRQLKALSPQQVIDSVCDELRAIWPAAADAELLHGRMITERRAVFSVLPGIDAIRPPQQTAIPHLQVAGDWTQTGWPATMEGAVRSGFLAAENILRRRGLAAEILQPDLSTAWAARWLFGLSRGTRRPGHSASPNQPLK